MLAVIGNKGIKIFVKALKYLAKYSPEYIFEAKDNKLILKTCSSSQVSVSFIFIFSKFCENKSAL